MDRRNWLLQTLAAALFPLLNLLNSLRRRASPEFVGTPEPPMIETPRLSWKYRPWMMVRNAPGDVVASVGRSLETILIEYHGMPEGKPYEDGSQMLTFGFYTIEFHREPQNWCGRQAVSLETAVHLINHIRTHYELTAEENASLDDLIRLISYDGSISNIKPPCPRQHFAVEWSSHPYANGSRAEYAKDEPRV